MNRLFTKYGTAVLSVSVVIAVLLSVMVIFSSGSTPLANILGTVATPFRTAGASVSAKFREWKDYFTEFDALKEENLALKQELAELESDIRQAKFFREENERLRELIGLREQRRDLTFESALIVESDISNWESLLTINKGTLHDISAGDCVVDETGNLVGVISEIGLNWATIRTILDSDTGIGAKVFRSGANAVAQGDFALMGDGRLAMNYLSIGSDVMNGDLIVTSGLGDYLPHQLVIGYVEELRTDDDGLSRYAIIRPEADIASLKQVFVITDFTIVD